MYKTEQNSDSLFNSFTIVLEIKYINFLSLRSNSSYCIAVSR